MKIIRKKLPCDMGYDVCFKFGIFWYGHRVITNPYYQLGLVCLGIEARKNLKNKPSRIQRSYLFAFLFLQWFWKIIAIAIFIIFFGSFTRLGIMWYHPSNTIYPFIWENLRKEKTNH